MAGKYVTLDDLNASRRGRQRFHNSDCKWLLAKKASRHTGVQVWGNWDPDCEACRFCVEYLVEYHRLKGCCPYEPSWV